MCNPEPVTYVREQNTVARFRARLFVGYDNPAVRNPVRNEPAISLGGEFRLGAVKVLRVSLDPEHDVRIGVDYIRLRSV